MREILDTVLLLALPASGKSEVRRYLKHLPSDVCRKDFHMGPTVQLDDFPYVHMMRRIDDELVARGGSRVFFHSPDRPFQDTRDWGTLIHLVNQDYEDLLARRVVSPASPAMHLFERLDSAALSAGGRTRLAQLDRASKQRLSMALDREAAELLSDKHKNYPASLDGRTLVIEFARGGPDKASMPLAAPLGYGYSIGELAPEILKKASILYVWVTPEESRRKNEARTDPNDPGSILHHGVPLEVMLKDYGCDDMDWLEANAKFPGTVRIEAGGKVYDIPAARFDNRVDKTSFLRDDPGKWPSASVEAVHEGLRAALAKLASWDT